jgi:hypothetical protein
MKLLVTTFGALLSVTLDEDYNLASVHVVDDRHGIYFGLSRVNRTTYVVARNLTNEGDKKDPRLPSNVIEIREGEDLSIVDRIHEPSFLDLHQIRAWRALLLVVRPGALLVVDRLAKSLLQTIALDDYVPPELRHEAPDEHPGDNYHFNSISFAGDRLIVLAHNWDHGSFALDFVADQSDLMAGRLQLRRVHRNIGHESHDLFLDSGTLYVLNSRENSLVAGDDSFAIGGAQFPRGLAATPTHFFAASGVWSEREGRWKSNSQLHILERPSFRLIATHDLGAYGNPCDVTFLDRQDLTDAEWSSKRLA